MQKTDYYLTDFHTHTISSKDCLTKPEKLIAACQTKKIDRVIITDHNTIAGAIRAKSLDPQRVIIGEEIMTTQGEILAAYVSEEIPPGLHPMDVIQRLRGQDAFISISHPFDKHRQGHWQPDDLTAVLPYIDAIETFNARCMLPHYNFRAQNFAQEHQLLGTYGSDAHTAWELGRGALLLPAFEDAATLREALKSAVVPPVILSTPFIHLASRYAVLYKRFKNML
ncbi:MAG: PHP-associated domain-containing protein [Chloroflexota bacterium]